MAYRMRKSYHRRRRHHRRYIGAVRSSAKAKIGDVVVAGVGAIAGGLLQSKIAPTMDAKIKGLATAVLGGLISSARGNTMKYLGLGVAASGFYGVARGFNLIGLIPNSVGLLPPAGNYSLPASQQHVASVGKANDLMMVGMLES